MMNEHDLGKPLLEERYLRGNECDKDTSMGGVCCGELDLKKDKRGFFGSMTVENRLICAIVFCLIFTGIELTVGLISNSLALISDASHLISDLCSYFISLFGIYLSKKKATKTMSFGYNRAEILGALLSILLIWIMTLMLLYEAIQRMMTPIEVNGFSMFITAVFGTLSNLFIGLVLSVHTHGIEPIGTTDCVAHCNSHNHETNNTVGRNNVANGGESKYIDFHPQPANLSGESKDGNHPDLQDTNDLSHSPVLGKKTGYFKNHDPGLCNGTVIGDYKDVNKKRNSICNPQNSLALWSAYIHVLGDVLQNIGVMIAGICIWYSPRLAIVDPLCTILFSFLVLGTTFRILRDSTNVLMEGTPIGIDCVAIQEDFLRLYSVLEVHDLHVWSLSVGVPALSCHIVVASEESARATLRYATALCQTKYGIYHTTIQIDYSPNKVTCGTIHHQKCLVGSNNFFSR